MDRSERLTGNADTEFERCWACPSKLMPLVQWRRLGEDRWEIDLRCPDCGGSVTGSRLTGRSGRKYGYYHCSHKDCGYSISRERASDQFGDFLEREPVSSRRG